MVSDQEPRERPYGGWPDEWRPHDADFSPWYAIPMPLYRKTTLICVIVFLILWALNGFHVQWPWHPDGYLHSLAPLLPPEQSEPSGATATDRPWGEKLPSQH